MLKFFTRGRVEQEVELDKQFIIAIEEVDASEHPSLSSVMMVCKNAIITFWNVLWNKNNNKYTSKLCYISIYCIKPSKIKAK